MEEEKEFNELFELSRFVPDAPFEEIIEKLENGRTIDKIKNKNTNQLISYDQFVKESKKPEKMTKEELKTHFENLEKQIEEELVN